VESNFPKGGTLKIERRDSDPTSERSWSVETDLDTWVGRIMWLVALVCVLVLLRLLGIDPTHIPWLR
jgi:hypothetical protein